MPHRALRAAALWAGVLWASSGLAGRAMRLDSASSIRPGNATAAGLAVAVPLLMAAGAPGAAAFDPNQPPGRGPTKPDGKEPLNIARRLREEAEQKPGGLEGLLSMLPTGPDVSRTMAKGLASMRSLQNMPSMKDLSSMQSMLGWGKDKGGAQAAEASLPPEPVRDPRDGEVRRVLYANTAKEKLALAHQLQAYTRFSGGHVTKLIDAEERDEGKTSYIYLFMEESDSDLRTVMASDPSAIADLSVDRKVGLVIELLRGLVKLEREGWVHRNVRPESVAIFGDCFSEEGCHAKLDELSDACALGELRSKKILQGTPRYLAPEVWEREGDFSKMDVWAAGMVLFELLTGGPPQALADDSAAEAWIFHPFRNLVPKEFDLHQDHHFQELKAQDPQAAELVDRMLSKDTKVRPTAAQAVQVAVLLTKRPRGSQQPLRFTDPPRAEPTVTKVSSAAAATKSAPAPKRSRAPAPAFKAPVLKDISIGKVLSEAGEALEASRAAQAARTGGGAAPGGASTKPAGQPRSIAEAVRAVDERAAASAEPPKGWQGLESLRSMGGLKTLRSMGQGTVESLENLRSMGGLESLRSMGGLESLRSMGQGLQDATKGLKDAIDSSQRKSRSRGKSTDGGHAPSRRNAPPGRATISLGSAVKAARESVDKRKTKRTPGGAQPQARDGAAGATQFQHAGLDSAQARGVDSAQAAGAPSTERGEERPGAPDQSFAWSATGGSVAGPAPAQPTGADSVDSAKRALEAMAAKRARATANTARRAGAARAAEPGADVAEGGRAGAQAGMQEMAALERFGGGDFVRLLPTGQTNGHGRPSLRTGVIAREAGGSSGWELSYSHKIRLFTEILRGLAKMDAEGWMHGDVSPENILLFGEDTAPHARLAGLACARPVEEATSATARQGPYAAPEVRGRVDGDLRRADMWSAGVLALELFLGRVPAALGAAVPSAEYYHFLQSYFQSDADFTALRRRDSTFARLVAGMLAVSPQERPSAQAAYGIVEGIAQRHGIPVPEQQDDGTSSA